MYKKALTFMIIFSVLLSTAEAKQKATLGRTAKRTKHNVSAEDKELAELKKIIKEKEALKAELQNIRTAQYLNTNKTSNVEEQKEQVLAPQTVVSVPVPAKEQSSFNKDFAAAIENSVSKGFKTTGDPIYNNFKTIFKYNITDIWNLKTEPSVTWKWTKNTDSSSAFFFNDWPLTLNNSSFFYSEQIMTTFSGSLVLSLPTSKWSRQADVISTVIANVVSKTDLNNYKGSLTITPEIAYVFRNYATSSPKGIDNVDPGQMIEIGGGDELYEILTPYNQFTTSVNVSFWHKLVDALSATIWIKFINTRMYGDYAYGNDGNLYTITPSTWINVFEFAQELKYEVSNKFNIKLGVSSIGNLAGYRPFSVANNNNVVCWLTLKYDFFNKTDF